MDGETLGNCREVRLRMSVVVLRESESQGMMELAGLVA
jgi:hypothetical protein